MPYQYFMAGENKHKRKRIMQLNTLGPGKRRSPVPPSSVLTMSGMSCQRGTALCPLPLGCGPQIKEINEQKQPQPCQWHFGMSPAVEARHPPFLSEPRALSSSQGLFLIPWYPYVLMVPCVEIHTSDAAKADWNVSQWDHSFFPSCWCSQQINLISRAVWSIISASEEKASRCW